MNDIIAPPFDLKGFLRSLEPTTYEIAGFTFIVHKDATGWPPGVLGYLRCGDQFVWILK